MVAIIKSPPVWARLSAIGGGITWLALLAVPLPDDDTTAWIIRAIHLAILVFVPLGLALAGPATRAGRTDDLYRVAVWLQPLAGLLVTLSFWRAPGIGAAALAGLWFVCTAIVAVYGATRLLRTRIRAAELCLCVGMLLLPVGGGWLLLDRAGLAPGGYGPMLILLIALHYHYAGFTAPLLTGLAGQRITAGLVRHCIRHIYGTVAAGVCVGSPLVTIGASSTPLLEVVAVVLLACSLVGLALLVLGCVVPQTRSLLVRGLLTISSSAVLLSMIMAVIYAVSNGIGHPILTISEMARIHGAANTVGFVLCGLLAWNVHPGRSPLEIPPPT